MSLKKHGFDPRVRKIPWNGKWQPTPVSLPGGLQSVGSQRVGHDWQVCINHASLENKLVKEETVSFIPDHKKCAGPQKAVNEVLLNEWLCQWRRPRAPDPKGTLGLRAVAEDTTLHSRYFRPWACDLESEVVATLSTQSGNYDNDWIFLGT